MFKIISTCKGGGYMYCRTEPKHPKANSSGLYPLHRVLMEIKLGRLLEPGEVVHHRDEDKSNNDPSNLEVLSNSQHSREHRPVVNPIVCECPECKISFEVKPNLYRLRLKRNKSTVLCCTKSCATKYQYKTTGLF